MFEINIKRLIKYIKKSSTIEFINNIMNKGIINNKKYFINTRISKKLTINEAFINKLFELFEKEDYTKNKLKQIFEIINLDKVNNISPEIKSDVNEINENLENKEEYNILDNCHLLDELNYQIKKYRKRNKENGKKIEIENEQKNSNEEDDQNKEKNESNNTSEYIDSSSESESSSDSSESESDSYSSSSSSKSDS